MSTITCRREDKSLSLTFGKFRLTNSHKICIFKSAISHCQSGGGLLKMKTRVHRTGSFRVLIVEDSTLFRQLVKEKLHDRFPAIELYQAIDGEEALLKVEALHPHLIFMDFRLPGENGLELTKKIKAQDPNIIVVILTGYDLPEYQGASWQYADYFFSKNSSTTENIFTLVESVLSTRE